MFNLLVIKKLSIFSKSTTFFAPFFTIYNTYWLQNQCAYYVKDPLQNLCAYCVKDPLHFMPKKM